MKTCYKGVLFAIALIVTNTLQAQSPHDYLVEITQQRAADLTSILQTDIDQSRAIVNSYVQEAVAIENLIVSADPDVSIIDEIRNLEKKRWQAVRDVLSKEQFDIYETYLENLEAIRGSEFDSLQQILTNDSFQLAASNYFDEMVAPYLLYYHQTFFKPALKEKFLWKINLARDAFDRYSAREDSIALSMTSNGEVPDDAELTRHLNALKKLRKKYRDELDYITVALGPVERQWTKDYIALVKSHFDDETYQKVEDYTYSLNAYGMDYIVSQFSLTMLNAWYPRSYLEKRALLMELFNKGIF